MQERLEADIQWLAGIVDSEGCISNSYRHPMVVHIGNCDMILMTEVKRILSSLGVYYSQSDRKSINPKWRNSQQVAVHNNKDCITVLKSIYPYLVGKKEICSLAIKFTESRTDKWGRPFSDEEKKMMSCMTELNVRGVQNPQRLCAERITPKIKSELNGDIQSTAEMSVPSLNWFGGIMDGDGCFSLTHLHSSWVPGIVITNTNQDIVQGVVNVLASREQGHYIRRRSDNARHKPQYGIDISGLKRCSKMLSWVCQCVRAKKDRADVLSKFVTSRLTDGGIGYDYKKEELALVEDLRRLNKTGN